MTVKPRTIDNLGVDASIRYAKDKELFETRFIEESKLVSQKTQISVATPYIPAELDSLFSVGKPLPWASFSQPPNYSPDFIFSYQLIPSLGGYEATNEEIDPKDLIEDALTKKRRKQKKKAKMSADDEKEKEEEEREKKILITLVECIARIDQSINLVNARRNQYQRG